MHSKGLLPTTLPIFHRPGHSNTACHTRGPARLHQPHPCQRRARCPTAPISNSPRRLPKAAVALCCPLLSLWALRHSGWWASCLPSRNGGPCAPHIGGWHCTTHSGVASCPLPTNSCHSRDLSLGWGGWRIGAVGGGIHGYPRTTEPRALLGPGSVTSDKWLHFS